MADFEKPSNLEDEYFAREDIEKKHKLAVKQAKEMADHEREELRKLHYMHCPKCGMPLHALKKGKVEVDMCFNCKGIWLEEGELQYFAHNEHEGFAARVMSSVLNIFKRRSLWGTK